MPPAIGFTDEGKGLAIIQPFDVMEVIEVSLFFVEKDRRYGAIIDVHQVHLIAVLAAIHMLQ